MTSIAKQLQSIRERINDAERLYHRPINSVKLLAVSKGKSVQVIKEAVKAGQHCFGENYLQEALTKISEMKHELPQERIEWHFIGNIQTNKTKAIAENFDWVHSVSRLNIAQRLSQQRPKTMAPLNICIEVNISAETSKSGIQKEGLVQLARSISHLPQLHLRGLMTIGALDQNPVQAREIFHELQCEFEDLKSQGFLLDTLSMGMTDDFELAIAEGSTCVRIGRAIFGERI